MNAVQTQPRPLVIDHAEVESELRALLPRRMTSLWGHTVHRLTLWQWSVDGSPPSSLLVSIDLVMSNFGGVETLW